MGSGRRAAAAGWSPPEAPVAVYRAAWCVSLLCGQRRRDGSGVLSRVPGGGRRDLVPGGVGVRARRNGNFAGSAGAGSGGRASSLHCAGRPRRRPRGVLLPGPLRRPAGQLARPRPCPPPSPVRSLAPAPPTLARPPGLQSRVGVGLRPRAPGTWHTGSSGLPASRVPGGLASRSRRGGLGSLPSVSAPSPATSRSPPLK